MTTTTTRPTRSRLRFPDSMLDLERYSSTAHGHDFDGPSRVIMVRKTDQRTFASTKRGEEPKYETVTRETIETFHGNRTERKVTSLETKDLGKSVDKLNPDGDPIPTSVSRSGTPRRIPNEPVCSRLRKNLAPNAEEFAEGCLKAHNECRSKHGVPPLKLNSKISKVSQAWANALARRGLMEHSKNQDYGENIFCGWSSKPNYWPTSQEPVDSWYEEHKKHEFGVEPKSLESGHFTQIVWRETQELGVGFAKGNDGKVFVVANYYPAGNFIGSFAENVPPVGGFSKATNSVGTTKKRSTSSNSEDFEMECLKAHNEYRQMHGVEPLKLNRKMCRYSEEWAKNLAIKGQMEHRKNSEYGENIFCSWSSNPHHQVNGREPVDNWYSEIKCHVFGREPNNLKSGHFTQVIWKDSRELGVAMAKNRNGQIFVVANYSPPGNFVGSFIENVPPLGGGRTLIKRTLMEINDDEFGQESVRIHNEYRRKHNCPDINYNIPLRDYAKEWALRLAKEEKLHHRPDPKYGENIFYFWSSDSQQTFSPKTACKAWYDEIKDYDWNSNSVRVKSTGHFTQMIWKGSTDLGMAMAVSKSGKIYVVANYNPRGNIIGQFTENVPKPK